MHVNVSLEVRIFPGKYTGPLKNKHVYSFTNHKFLTIYLLSVPKSKSKARIFSNFESPMLIYTYVILLSNYVN